MKEITNKEDYISLWIRKTVVIYALIKWWACLRWKTWAIRSSFFIVTIEMIGEIYRSASVNAHRWPRHLHIVSSKKTIDISASGMIGCDIQISDKIAPAFAQKYLAPSHLERWASASKLHNATFTLQVE